MDRCSICSKCSCFHASKVSKYEVRSSHRRGGWMHRAGKVCVSEDVHYEEIDVDDVLETLKQKKDCDTTFPTYVAANEAKLRAKGIGTVCGRLLIGTAEKIPPSELVDTTALCTNMAPEKMLPFASQVAAIGCRTLGARTGLPQHTDPRLTTFLI